MLSCPAFTEPETQRIQRIAESYLRLAGKPLVPTGGDPLAALWSAPMAIVAHDTAADPVFFFGNALALQLFEMDYPAFIRLPSRLSAEPLLREERARLLDRVTRTGLITDYAGVRISASGRRFRIRDAAVWNLIDDIGEVHGQAAAFADWQPLTA